MDCDGKATTGLPLYDCAVRTEDGCYGSFLPAGVGTQPCPARALLTLHGNRISGCPMRMTRVRSRCVVEGRPWAMVSYGGGVRGNRAERLVQSRSWFRILYPGARLSYGTIQVCKQKPTEFSMLKKALLRGLNHIEGGFSVRMEW